jgi:hypothetical protein
MQGILTTRRQVIVGTASAAALTATRMPATAFGPWWIEIGAAVAAALLVEALKKWGLLPWESSPTTVQAEHDRQVTSVQQDGYSVQPLYSGAYSGGDLKLSKATRGDDFLALSTSNHGPNVCTIRLEKPDAVNLALVADALRQSGFNAGAIQAATLPVHPPAASQFAGNQRQSPEFMTPSHGMISWSTNWASSRPNLATSIRSGIVNADLRFAQLDSGDWTYDIK